jgi:hypothetical protein
MEEREIFSKLVQMNVFILKKISQKTHNNRLLKLPKTKMGNSDGHRNVRQNIIDDLTQ